MDEKLYYRIFESLNALFRRLLREERGNYKYVSALRSPSSAQADDEARKCREVRAATQKLDEYVCKITKLAYGLPYGNFTDRMDHELDLWREGFKESGPSYMRFTSKINGLFGDREDPEQVAKLNEMCVLFIDLVNVAFRP